LGKSPSTCESSVTSQPKARKIAGADAPAMPFAVDHDVFMGRWLDAANDRAV
jgi:hypothetical protein